jgi:hypothetical protein
MQKRSHSQSIACPLLPSPADSLTYDADNLACHKRPPNMTEKDGFSATFLTDGKQGGSYFTLSEAFLV